MNPLINNSSLSLSLSNIFLSLFVCGWAMGYGGVWYGMGGYMENGGVGGLLLRWL